VSLAERSTEVLLLWRVALESGKGAGEIGSRGTGTGGQAGQVTVAAGMPFFSCPAPAVAVWRHAVDAMVCMTVHGLWRITLLDLHATVGLLRHGQRRRAYQKQSQAESCKHALIVADSDTTSAAGHGGGAAVSRPQSASRKNTHSLGLELLRS